MKKVNIFIIGKYEYKSNIGTWIYYLNHNKAVIKRSGNIKNAGSPNRVLLTSLYLALQRMLEPCEITVYSKSALGFKNPKQSVNKDLIIKIQQTINKAGHNVKFDTTNDFGIVNIWEQVYGTKSDGTKVKQSDKMTQPDIKNKTTPNSVFEHKSEYEPSDEEIEQMYEKHKHDSGNWRDMYSDLMCESNGAWVQGSGGY